MAMKENSCKVLEYLKSIGDADVTSADVAEALGFEKKATVDGCFTSFQKKGLGVRVEAEIETDEGKHQTVKFLKLTDAGKAFVPGVTDAE